VFFFFLEFSLKGAEFGMFRFLMPDVVEGRGFLNCIFFYSFESSFFVLVFFLEGFRSHPPFFFFFSLVRLRRRCFFSPPP